MEKYKGNNVKGKQGSQKKDFATIKQDFESMGLILLTKEEEYVNTITPMNFICEKHKNEGIQKMSYHQLRARIQEGKYGCVTCYKEYKHSLKQKKIKCGIYKITNIKNNKIYIGKSKDIDKRWFTHIYEFNNNTHVNPHLQRAWKKYGEESFKFEIIEECSEEELNEKEVYYISLYKATDPEFGYNLRGGGEGGSVSEDVRKRMSKLQRGKRASLTYGDVRKIKMCLFLSMNRKELADMYGVSTKVITEISTANTYSYVLPELNGKMTGQKQKALEKRNKEILKLYDSGMTKAQIVKEYGYTISVVEKCISKFRDEKVDKSESIYLYNKSIELHNQGMSNYDIGKLLGIETRRVKRYVDGIQNPTREVSNKKVTDEVSQYIYDNYFKNKIPIKDIAKSLSISRNTIELEINKYLYAGKSTPFTNEQCAS